MLMQVGELQIWGLENDQGSILILKTKGTKSLCQKILRKISRKGIRRKGKGLGEISAKDVERASFGAWVSIE